MDNHDNQILEDLRRLIDAIEASGRSVIPGSANELLQSIVAAAAQIFGAAAASIALIDEDTGELVFRVAYGAGGEEVVGMRIPLNRGIAGYVALTGQPIAISNVRDDARFNRDFAASTGYIPTSILATPLLLDDRVIGVMEVLDKINAETFGMQDMELLGVFAQQAAFAINQAEKIELLGQAMIREMKDITARSDGRPTAFLALLEAEDGGAPGASVEVNLLVDLYREIGAWGDAERTAVLKMMSAFADYVRSRPRFD